MPREGQGWHPIFFSSRYCGTGMLNPGKCECRPRKSPQWKFTLMTMRLVLRAAITKLTCEGRRSGRQIGDRSRFLAERFRCFVCAGVVCYATGTCLEIFVRPGARAGPLADSSCAGASRRGEARVGQRGPASAPRSRPPKRLIDEAKSGSIDPGRAGECCFFNGLTATPSACRRCSTKD